MAETGAMSLPSMPIIAAVVIASPLILVAVSKFLPFEKQYTNLYMYQNLSKI